MEKNYIMKNLIISTLQNIVRMIKLTKVEMGQACSKHLEIRNSCVVLIRKSVWKDHFEDQAVDGRVILKYMLCVRLCT